MEDKRKVRTLQKSQLLGNVASTLAIAYVGEQYVRRYGPRSVMAVRERIYGTKCDQTEATYKEALESAKIDAEYRWTASVEDVALRYLADNNITFGYPGELPKENQLEGLRQHYIMYVIDTMTQSQFRRLVEIRAKRKALKPAVYVAQVTAQFNERLKQLRKQLGNIFTDDHLTVDPVPVC